MITSHLQTLGRSIIIGDNANDVNRCISTLALFCTEDQRNLSRYCVIVENTCKLKENPELILNYYVPQLYIQGIVIYDADIRMTTSQPMLRLQEVM